MKNKYILCFILLWLQYETIAQGGLRITWPLDRTVFQRDANGGTDVWFAGEFGYQQLVNGGNDVQYYVYPVDKQTGVRSATAIAFSGQVFVNVSNALSSPHGNIKTFFGKLGRLNTGWYDLEVSITKNIVCGFASNRSAKRYVRFGVGDVFITAGQSNASGYTFGDDAGSIPHHTANLDIPDAVNFLNGSFLSFRNIQNKPDNEKVQMPRALPLGINVFLQDKEKRHKFDAFEVTPTTETPATHPDQNEVNIYPNGQASWTWAPMAHKMYQNGNQVPMMFFNAAWPGSSSLLWNPDANGDNTNPHWIYGQFRDVLLMYGHIFGVKRILWQQGEDDRTTPQQDYELRIGKTITQSRNDLGHPNLSWSIAKSTYDGRFNPTILGSIQQAQQNLANANKIGASTDDITNWNNSNGRGEAMKVHFSGAAHNTVGERWANTFGSSTDGTPFTGGQELQQITITDNGSTFRLQAPTNYQRYFWVKNENGLYNTENTSKTQNYFDVPKGSNTVDYYTCYMSNDIDDNASNGFKMKMFVSQSFVVPNSIDAEQTLDLADIFYLNAPKVASNKIALILSKNVDWSVGISQDAQSWLSTSQSCGYDGLTNLNIIVQENTTTDTRDGLITITGSNGNSKTIPVSQVATTDCQTPLTNLTPTNPQSEWQGYGTMQINKSIDLKTPLQVGGTVPTISGIGTHAYSRLVYNIGGQYTTFSGKVGLDDEVDNGCGSTQKVRFIIKGNGNELYNSGEVNVTDIAKPFSVVVTGINTLELIVEPLENYFCDHTDWLDPLLSCSASSCTIPSNPTSTYAASPTISAGGSTQLYTTCPSGSAANWNTGQVNSPVTVTPTSTSTYTVRCKSNSGGCESVEQGSVTVTVGSTPPSSGIVGGNCYAISPLTNLNNNMQAMGDNSIKQQAANGATNQLWRAEGNGTQMKFKSVATDQYITVGTPNYADHMYLANNSNNYQSWNIDAYNGNYRLSIPSYNITWDMEGAGGGQYLQNYGTTADGFNNWRLWRFQSVACTNTSTPPSGITNNNCYVIRSVQTNNPLQAMNDGKIQQQSANGQNNQIFKAEASGNQYQFKALSNSQYIRVANSNFGTKMELGGAMGFDMQANGGNYRISQNTVTWDMEGAGSGQYLQNYGTTADAFQNYRLWSFQNVTCPNNPSNNCTDRFVSIGEATYASSPFGINTNANQNGGPLQIGGNGVSNTYAKGLGTHAFSEIIYDLGNHTFTKFKADVGRDFGSYNCNCGGQTMVFKIVNDNTGAVISNPTSITKGNWQNSTAIEANIAGVSRIKLVVEDGGDAFYGDWADWANARFTCPNSNAREAEKTPPAPIEEKTDALSIFPNPSNDKLTAKFGLAESANVSFEIIDLQGRNLETHSFKGEAGVHAFIIDVSTLNEGSYILRSVLGTQIMVTKFVVER